MRKLLLAATALVSITCAAQADIISTVGLTQIGAPSTVGADFLLGIGQTQIIFAEQNGVALSNPLATDTGVIPAGSAVSSYFFAVNTFAVVPSPIVDTSVTFDTPVLGIVYLNDSPNYAGTNFLGALGTTYNLPCAFCGFELFPDLDAASFSGNTVTFHNDYAQPGDFARIITEATPAAVPGPIVGAGIPGLVAACLGLVALVRRRKATSP